LFAFSQFVKPVKRSTPIVVLMHVWLSDALLLK